MEIAGVVFKKQFLTKRLSLVWGQAGGYSLIELMTGVTVLAILALASVNLFLTTQVGSTKTDSVREVKQNGDFVISQLEADLRSAARLLPNLDFPATTCEMDMESLSVELADGSVVSWYVNQSRVVADRDGLVAEALTSSGLQVVGDRLFVDCTQDSGSNSAFVAIRFSLEKGSSGANKQEERANSTFETSVTLRNK